MKKRVSWVVGIVLVSLGVLLHGQDVPRGQSSTKQNWTNYVRIGAYGLTPDNAQQIVDEATKDGVAGIEVDNDIPGRYESFLDPEQKLAAIRKVAAAAHKANNHAIVYIAGTECITANAEHTKHTLAKDHPDWLQRKITGEPAMFGSGNAFWISPGDEDVWVSPFAPEWRKTYMERVRQIAATGIDGIYVDIPYWMTHFDGWEDTWASFDDYTVAAFRKQTGLDARKDLNLGDFSDPNFRKWVDFRMQTLTDFMHDIDRNAKSVNPKIITVAEIYPGIEQEAVRVGADVYQMYGVLDGIAHEYEFGEGDHMASARDPLVWFEYQVGMASFRAFAAGKPSWILNYSWDGDKKVDPGQSMQNLAMSQLMANANFWDAKGHVMSGSNDPATRRRILHWIGEHQDAFYKPHRPLHPIGVYFSPATRNYFAKDFLSSYRGVLILLMQKHLEYQVVTPRTLAAFHGETLILPDVRVLDDGEKSALKTYVAKGNTVVLNGTDVSRLADSPNVVRFENDPGRAYMTVLDHDFETANPDSQTKFLAALKNHSEMSVDAPLEVVTNIAEVNGKECAFIANFEGLRGHENPVQTPVNVRITFSGRTRKTMDFLSFLGAQQQIQARKEAGHSVFVLPAIEKGAVACANGN